VAQLLADRLRLAQSSLLRGRTGTRPALFSLFHSWLSAGDWLFGVVKGGGENYPRLSSEFGGHGLSLFWIYLREFVFGSFGRPMGRTAASSPPWSYADARVCTELKLVWFGKHKIKIWDLCFGMPGAFLSSVSPIRR
jgi:hypothetical protein